MYNTSKKESKFHIRGEIEFRDNTPYFCNVFNSLQFCSYYWARNTLLSFGFIIVNYAIVNEKKVQIL